MIKIGLSGKTRSGKSTVAKFLQEEFNFSPFAFGDAMKKEFHEDYPHIPEEPKPIKAYQYYGQLKRITHGDTVWIDKVDTRIKTISEWAENYNITGEMPPFMPMITDVRQVNEFDYCVQNGFVMIRVECPTVLRLQRLENLSEEVDETAINFPTETELDNHIFDYQINNNGSLEDLYAKVREVMQDIIKKKTH